MCGIFGLIACPPAQISSVTLQRLAHRLFEQSETRGKDASGIVTVNDAEILIYKEPQRASDMMKSRPFVEVMAEASQHYGDGQAFVMAGHTRMVTNGSEDNDDNNQPVIKGDLVLLHNGIIVNDLVLWQQHPELSRAYQVDTEVFAALVGAATLDGQSLAAAMDKAFREAKGANTIAAIHAGCEAMVLGTTNGSLYFWTAPELGVSLFASEEYILRQALQELAGEFPGESPAIIQVQRHTLLALSLRRASAQLLPVDDGLAGLAGTAVAGPLRQIRQLRAERPVATRRAPKVGLPLSEIERYMQVDRQAIAALRRCSRCLLPETFPFIEYDAAGVCQFCRQHRPTRLQGAEALQQLADKARCADGKANCLVPISGGRDSCYGLHYIKKELGLNPVAYTYDWGFVTDLARRNISRLCGELNVEHVLVAADIRQKRENVRKNVCAWLAKPTLSMIPLFMAGDKAFFHYASMIKRQMNLGPILFSMNWLEKTGFKTGFAGVNDTASHENTYGLTRLNKLKLIAHYGLNFLRNPLYINGSIPDTLFGFLSYYLHSKDYYSIFDFLAWDQAEIERSIIHGYDWETSPDTTSTWRIGDGTAPFYNYIYLTVAGFSEHDTFRSNEIREGMLDRETAMRTIEEENAPRAESFKWYCETVGIDTVEALKVINKIPKYYSN
jgi:hypothetical protein